MSTIPMEKNNRLSNPLIKFSGMPMRVVSRNPVQFTYKMQKTISKAVLEEVEETGNPRWQKGIKPFKPFKGVILDASIFGEFK